jgi:hypothetical protein
MIDFQKGGIIALGILLGAFFGSKLALELDELTMRRCFAGFLVIVAGYIAFKP